MIVEIAELPAGPANFYISTETLTVFNVIIGLQVSTVMNGAIMKAYLV